MKKTAIQIITRPLTALLMIFITSVMVSCDDTETYGDMKEKERNAISDYIKEKGIKVISEEVFHAQGDTTYLDKNEFVYLNNSGVYMQIVSHGNGSYLEENKQVNLLCRFAEYNIQGGYFLTRNDTDPRAYDIMTVQRTGSTYTGVFASGTMNDNYGSSVPSGWLVALPYLRLDPQDNPDHEIARVNLIVPHSQGTATASGSVYPCYYTITLQRQK